MIFCHLKLMYLRYKKEEPKTFSVAHKYEHSSAPVLAVHSNTHWNVSAREADKWGKESSFDSVFTGAHLSFLETVFNVAYTGSCSLVLSLILNMNSMLKAQTKVSRF